MSSKTNITGHIVAFAVVVAGMFALSAITASHRGLAQTAPEGGTTAIQRGTEGERALNLPDPSYTTREERLNAKPLDWNSTIGTPRPHTLTAEERRALQRARPESSAGGAPNARAEAEARRLHPDDWK